MRTVYREKRYYCGEYLDVYIYPTYRQGRSRGKRSKPTSAAQAKLNQRHREEKLVRLLHANFTPDDIEIHLTYQQQPESPEEAQRLLRNYIRRVQRARKKQGLPPLKYIAVTEKGSKNGRYHYHVTLSGGMDRDELEKLWGLGYANSRRLQFTESGLAGLGHYIVKSPLYARAWNASKNLIDPEPKTRDGRISGKRAEELARDTTNNAEYERLYPGYFLADAGAWHNDVNGGNENDSKRICKRSPRKRGRAWMVGDGSELSRGRRAHSFGSVGGARGVARRQSGYLRVLWYPGRGVRVRGRLRQGRENRHLQAGGSRRRALRRDYPHPRLPRLYGRGR